MLVGIRFAYNHQKFLCWWVFALGITTRIFLPVGIRSAFRSAYIHQNLSCLSASKQQSSPYFFFLRKEVIQPHLPIRLPCYDFTPVIRPAFGGSLLAVGSPTSGISDSHGVTGGVYKTRERIHRGILIRDY